MPQYADKGRGLCSLDSRRGSKEFGLVPAFLHESFISKISNLCNGLILIRLEQEVVGR
jgi:hypothetical protein